jgi:putative nucleotidyltransferase with HDIG domain
MLRAVRFAVRFDFTIEQATWEGIVESASRLDIVSAERIRDEFRKILLVRRASQGLALLKDSGLMHRFAPELLEMVGVEQNAFHAFPVWEHTLAAVDALPADSSLILRLATLLHDIGKPRTREVDSDGHVHFYRHEDVGSEMARQLLQRLRFTGDEIDSVSRLVAEHMRIGEYAPAWTDSAVRRLIRDLGDSLNDLFVLHAADVAALAPEHRDMSRARELRARIAEIQSREDILAIKSPLDGLEIMALLGLTEGRLVGRIKDYLTNEVVEGRLDQRDTDSAQRLARQIYQKEMTP